MLPIKKYTIHYIITMSEKVYLEALHNVLAYGEDKTTRNSTTRSIFGVNMQFNISHSFPLLTSKRMYWNGILGELLWFIKGDTNALHLASKDIHIWDLNSSREFLDSVGLPQYPVGDCGPIYGFQWRRFNAEYKGCDYVYSKTDGIDQLEKCIELIKTDPSSRRIFMSAWNPQQFEDMCLPPCHVSYQFHVNNSNEISCSMYQRSGDMFLGIPFNIASTACLVYMIAHLTNKKPGRLIINIGDAHIYQSHIQSVDIQLSRHDQLYPLPTLEIRSRGQTTIDDYVAEDFILKNYVHHGTIKGKMVA
jgi:thymidylate synthase